MNTGDQITVNAPSICKNEIKWTLEQVLDEFLGIKYFLKFHDKDFFSISSSINNEELILETEFFNSLNEKWLDKSSLPNEKPLIMNCSFLKNSCQLMYEEIPVVFGKNKIHQSKNKFSLGFDIFGSIFFLLSRYESIPFIWPSRDAKDILLLFLDNWSEFTEIELHYQFLKKFIYVMNIPKNLTYLLQYSKICCLKKKSQKTKN